MTESPAIEAIDLVKRFGGTAFDRPAVDGVSFTFLDEPTTGLDPRSRSELWDVLRGLVEQGTTLLLTTQYLEEADQLADNIVVIDKGRIIAEGSPLHLKRQAGNASLVVTVANADDLPAARALLAKTGAEVIVDAGAAISNST